MAAGMPECCWRGGRGRSPLRRVRLFVGPRRCQGRGGGAGGRVPPCLGDEGVPHHIIYDVCYTFYFCVRNMTRASMYNIIYDIQYIFYFIVRNMTRTSMRSETSFGSCFV